jgi:hypothetical protein
MHQAVRSLFEARARARAARQVKRRPCLSSLKPCAGADTPLPPKRRACCPPQSAAQGGDSAAAGSSEAVRACRVCWHAPRRLRCLPKEHELNAARTARVVRVCVCVPCPACVTTHRKRT